MIKKLESLIFNFCIDSCTLKNTIKYMTDTEQKYTPIEKRAIGCLFGQTTGDALGTRYEFGSSEKTLIAIAADMQIKLPKVAPKVEFKKTRRFTPPKFIIPTKTSEEWATYLCSKGHLEILGGGPFYLSVGQVTDDSELALALADGLVSSGYFDIWSIADNYAIWHNSGPFDQGGTTRAALCKTSISHAAGINYELILNCSNDFNKASLSNGCLMRISPLAIAGTYWDEESLSLSAKMDCELTNPNPITLDAVSVYVVAIRTAILTGDAKASHEAAKKRANTKEVLNLLTMAETTSEVKLSNGRIVEPDGSMMGYFGIALQLAFYHLLKGSSYEHALMDVIIRGGDTDTNAVIVGALLGALYGYEAIPIDWINSVTKAKTQWRRKEYPLLNTKNLPTLAINLLKTVEPDFTEDFVSTNKITEDDSDIEPDDVKGTLTSEEISTVDVVPFSLTEVIVEDIPILDEENIAKSE